MVPARRFLKTAKTTWNSLWERWLPDFAWRLLVLRLRVPERPGLDTADDR